MIFPKRPILIALACGLVAGCAEFPDDGAQYFNNVANDTSALDAEQARLAAAENQPVTAATDGTTDGIATSALGDPNLPLGSEDTGAATDPIATASTDGISNTQDFTAISEQETIESDAAKLAALKDNYQVVDPSAVPTRSDSINLAAYALQSKNPVGERVYRRISIGLASCGKYRADPDAAQRAFLAAGGPQKDRLNLDPDGDGFACKWDPEVYRRLLPQG